MAITKKKTGTGRKRVQNYLNNARLMENIITSKVTWNAGKEKAAKRRDRDVAKWEKACIGINDPDAMPPKPIPVEKYWPSAAECMTPELVKMIMMLVDKYGTRANWRGYTYIDDMKAEALVSLLNGTLKFDPEKSQNPFGYMTQIVTHSFLTTLDKEKKVRRIRDDILEQHGFSPSHTRQLENEAGVIARSRRMVEVKEGLITNEEAAEEAAKEGK